ncbi:MAG: PAS domain S-box protein [Planctomycetota bacterium]
MTEENPKQPLESEALLNMLEDLEAEKKKAEESEEKLHQITEGIGEAVCLVSSDFEILWANTALTRQTGYTHETIIGQPCFQITHNRKSPCKAPHDPCPLQDALKTGKPAHAVHTHFNKNGNKFFAEVGVYPIKDKKRKIDIFVHISRDITEKKQAEEKIKESQEKYKTLFENTADAIFIADLKTKKLVDCNKAAEKLIGYTKKQILTMTADQLHPRDKIKETMEKFRKQVAGKLMVVKTEVLTKDKKKIPVAINSAPIKIRNKEYLQGIFRRSK